MKTVYFLICFDLHAQQPMQQCLSQPVCLWFVWCLTHWVILQHRRVQHPPCAIRHWAFNTQELVRNTVPTTFYICNLIWVSKKTKWNLFNCSWTILAVWMSVHQWTKNLSHHGVCHYQRYDPVPVPFQYRPMPWARAHTPYLHCWSIVTRMKHPHQPRLHLMWHFGNGN